MTHTMSSSSSVMPQDAPPAPAPAPAPPAAAAGGVPKRPPRACTARTPSRLAPMAPSIQRAAPRATATTANYTNKHHHHHHHSSPPAPMPLLTPPPSPAHKERWHLRSMWEFASIIHFLHVFRPVLSLKFHFSIDELETALISPNVLLDDIHMALLKAIPPISRAPLSRELWVTMLCKKLKEWWHWVAEGPFPLVPYHGEEVATYKELGADVRVVILKALCEVRLDQDDMRSFIDNSLKQGAPYSAFRKERTGVDMQGTTYWYEFDPVAGQRLYRELRKADNKTNFKLRGRLVPPPVSCHWETLATNLDEFQVVADKLSLSRNRMEAGIGRRIMNDIIPELKDLQKKKDRAVKKQQRQALLLDSYFNTGGLTSGRSRRERKPVTYTFDDYDKSISEAIKITKRRQSSPESFVAGDSKDMNGFARQSEGGATSTHSEAHNLTEAASQSKLNEGSLSSDSDFSPNGKFRRSRHHRRPQRYSESEFVEAVSDNEADAYTEDEIEGEAVYDDDYVQKRKVRKSSTSSDGDEEYRGEEDDDGEDDDDDDNVDDDDDDDDDDDYKENDTMGFSDDGDYVQKQHRLKNTRSKRKGEKLKSVEELQRGLRRSKRATRSNVDYSKYEESDLEGDEGSEGLGSPQRVNHDRVVNLASSLENMGDSCDSEEQERTGRPADSNDMELEVGHGSKESHKGVAYRQVNGLKSDAHVKPENKLRRYLDLNVAAPVGGGYDDSSAGCSRGQNGSLSLATRGESCDDDESTCDSPRDGPLR